MGAYPPVDRDGHGLGSMAIYLAHHCFTFNIKYRGGGYFCFSFTATTY